jgi:hypothetical protein
MAVYNSKDPFRVKPWCADVYKGSTRVKRYFATELLSVKDAVINKFAKATNKKPSSAIRRSS